jgi:hypothetical protein
LQPKPEADGSKSRRTRPAKGCSVHCGSRHRFSQSPGAQSELTNEPDPGTMATRSPGPYFVFGMGDKGSAFPRVEACGEFSITWLNVPPFVWGKGELLSLFDRCGDFLVVVIPTPTQGSNAEQLSKSILRGRRNEYESINQFSFYPAPDEHYIMVYSSRRILGILISSPSYTFIRWVRDAVVKWRSRVRL